MVRLGGRMFRPIAVALAVIAGLGLAGARADNMPPVQNANIVVSYLAPAKAEFRPIYDRLRTNNALEQLSGLLAPLNLPSRMFLTAKQCDAEHAPDDRAGPVIVCYEEVARIEQIAKQPTAINVPREHMIIAAFIQMVLHKSADAVLHAYNAPVWGRREDAADRIAALIMLNFGPEIAQYTILGAAAFFEASEKTWTGSDFASVRSPEAQRYYNYLCMAYGQDPTSFKSLVEEGFLPEFRAVRCPGEYQEAAYAFGAVLMPNVDQAKMREVRVMIPAVSIPMDGN